MAGAQQLYCTDLSGMPLPGRNFLFIYLKKKEEVEKRKKRTSLVIERIEDEGQGKAPHDTNRSVYNAFNCVKFELWPGSPR